MLLFELKNDKNIICFMPSGHLVADKFADLPAQREGSCWYEIAYRLASIEYTQKPFMLAEQPLMVRKITHIKEQLVALMFDEQLCNFLLKDHLNVKNFDKLLEILSLNLLVNTFLGDVKNIPTEVMQEITCLFS